MATRAEFFAGLSPCAIEPVAMPSLNFSPLDAPVLQVFRQMLAAVGGIAGAGSTLPEVDQFARSLLDGGSHVLSLVDGVTGSIDTSTVHSPRQLAHVDYTIAPARLRVAENGSVWIDGRDLPQRSAVFICEHLVVTCHAASVVGTLSDAMRQLGSVAGNWGAFISGPSKTADIEQSLVIGAHGARSCTVFLLAD